jgi:hypothetical protein
LKYFQNNICVKNHERLKQAKVIFERQKTKQKTKTKTMTDSRHSKPDGTYIVVLRLLLKNVLPFKGSWHFKEFISRI